MRTTGCILLLFAFGVANATEDQVTNVCSKYSFHRGIKDWSAARRKCSDQGNGLLVSMETEREWHFVLNLAKNQTKPRWFIGLKTYDGSHTWSWLNESIAWVYGTSAGTWRWNNGEPNNFKTEHCVEMWQNGKYNNIKCQAASYHDNPGYICENKVSCSIISNNSENEYIFIERTRRPRSTPQPLTTKTTSTLLRTQSTNTQNKLLSVESTQMPQTPEATRFKESATKVAQAYTQPTNGTLFTLRNQPTFNLPTQGTTFKNTVSESSPRNVSTGKLNLVWIIIALLVIFLLAIAVVLGILFFRRHQSRKNRDHLHDRISCTYEVPLSSELQSFDPVPVQQMQSSAELTVHLTISQTESGPAIYETLSDCEKECEYDDVDKTNQKSMSVNTVLVSGEKGIEQPSALCDNKEENKDHVYAVVHKERKGRASSEASTLKKSSDRPQGGTSGLPLNRGSCVDCIDRSSHPADSGFQNNVNTAESETLQPGGSIGYLYAAVDKTKKKRKQPQKPPPYSDDMYASLVHSRESSAKLVKEHSQNSVRPT